MPDHSTGKRPFEVDEDEDPERENHRLDLKRLHDVYSRSVSASRSSSRSSYGRASSLETLNNEVQKMFVASEPGVAGAAPRNCKPPQFPIHGNELKWRRPSALVRSAKHLGMSIASSAIYILE